MIFTIGQLADLIEGRLHLADMPPIRRGGEPLGRMVSDLEDIECGDLFWAIAEEFSDFPNQAEVAFSRGAKGVVASRRCHPFPGGYAIEVPSVRVALDTTVEHFKQLPWAVFQQQIQNVQWREPEIIQYRTSPRRKAA